MVQKQIWIFSRIFSQISFHGCFSLIGERQCIPRRKEKLMTHKFDVLNFECLNQRRNSRWGGKIVKINTSRDDVNINLFGGITLKTVTWIFIVAMSPRYGKFYWWRKKNKSGLVFELWHFDVIWYFFSPSDTCMGHTRNA